MSIKSNNNKKLSKEEALREYEIMLADQGVEIAEGLQAYDRMTFDQIYQGYKGILIKTKIFIPLLYEKGRDEGKSAEQIQSKIAELGIEYKTMMTYTPDWAKRKQIHGPRTKRVNKTLTQNQARLVTPEEPKIPPSPQVEKEAEVEPEPSILIEDETGKIQDIKIKEAEPVPDKRDEEIAQLKARIKELEQELKKPIAGAFKTIIVGKDRLPSNWDRVLSSKEDNVFCMTFHNDKVTNVEVKGRKIAMKLYG